MHLNPYGEDAVLFSGAFWCGEEARALGLVDGIGDLRAVMRQRFGDDVQLRLVEPRSFSLGRLFGAAPAIGAPLLRARFARAYVDPNREAFELDAALFEGLPKHVNAGSVRARAGLGTIPSRISGESIYRWRLSFEEAERRVQLAYWPYHRALQGLLARAHAAFGTVLLLGALMFLPVAALGPFAEHLGPIPFGR